MAINFLWRIILIICFMLLSVTGVAWMYIETGFGKTLAWPSGGAEGAVWVHKLEAILAMAHIFVVHFFIESYRPSAFPLKLSH